MATIDLSNLDLEALTNKIAEDVMNELVQAIQSGSIQKTLDLVNEESPNCCQQLINPRMKILVVGDLRGRQSDYVAAAKKLGIKESNLEFISYDDMKKFSPGKLRYSNVYSDIIVGPIPHKIAGLDGSSSLVAAIENANDKETYPKLIRTTTNSNSNKLKFSVSSFMNCLVETKLYKELNSDYES